MAGARPSLRVGITGANGALGQQLTALLRAGGHEVVAFGRQRGMARFDARGRFIDREAMEGLDALAHLAGAPIAVRWSEAARREILDSRVAGTETVVAALTRLRRPPAVLVSASATGYYGARAAPVDEDASPGEGFAAEVCVAWERAARPAVEAGVRLVQPRIGVVLDAGSGALARMLPAFRLGVGGPLGSGRQAMSWISVDDLCRALLWLITQEQASGVYNLVAPEAVPQAVFARALGAALGRPAIVPTPAWALRLALGAMADELLLQGAAVQPRRLLEQGFGFAHPDLATALAALLAAGRGTR